MKLEAIVVAAGAGKRLGRKQAKALVCLGGVPIIIRALRALSAHPGIEKIIVVCRRQDIVEVKSLIVRYAIRRIKCVVAGGKRRRDSVSNGLRALSGDTGLVLIHDAARPFVDAEIISRLLRAGARCGAAIAAVPAKDTMKLARRLKGKEVVERTLPRDRLWQAQTPQVFRRDWIVQGHRLVKNKDITDDACLIERLGKKVALVWGSYANIKITTPEDI